MLTAARTSTTSPLLKAMALRRLVQRTEELAIATDKPPAQDERESLVQQSLVRQAMASPEEWLLNYTRTYNLHWADEGYESPNEPFPPYDYCRHTLQILNLPTEKVILVEKSRDMMASWLCVGFFTYWAQKRPFTQCLFQSLEKEKAWDLVGYAKQLWKSQSKALRDAYPLTKDVEDFAQGEMIYQHGSEIIGIPGGKDKLRSYHPWGYLSDETSFQPEAGKCYAAALPACNKLILNSSASSSWFSDFRNDVQT